MNHYKKKIAANNAINRASLEKNLLFMSSAGSCEIVYNRGTKETKMQEKRFTSGYQDWAYKGRRIHPRDKAWLEFVPKGDNPPDEHMFQHATLLESNDEEIKKQLGKDRYVDSKDVDTSKFDVYYVYRTTTG